jgi:hypothetical protein
LCKAQKRKNAAFFRRGSRRKARKRRKLKAEAAAEYMTKERLYYFVFSLFFKSFFRKANDIKRALFSKNSALL